MSVPTPHLGLKRGWRSVLQFIFRSSAVDLKLHRRRSRLENVLEGAALAAAGSDIYMLLPITIAGATQAQFLSEIIRFCF